MSEVRRDGDGELCGHVRDDGDGGWSALAVFGGVLARCADRGEAIAMVRADGLSSLADHWLLTDPETGVEEIVCIQEAGPQSVTVALGHYSMPGVPTRTVSRAELDGGRVQLRRRRT